ncbi:ral guanine nucleotide dissociation stimulator-like [Castor canadensis]|uniref:Ral guanine nucleotide dissociation stimulator-like n=1 Tax=Castor canadensis TaxID=51338 RepID=A0AC58LAF5_CASCN
MDEAEPGMRGQALTFQSGPSSSLRWRTGETNMFPCCLRAYEGSEDRTTQSEGHDHVLTCWVSPRSGRLKRFSHRIPKGANELAPTLADPCKAGMLKAGTLEELVDHLVPALLFGDPTYIPIFLCTYRRFATTQQVLDLLFTRYASFFLYSNEVGGPRQQLKLAMSYILGTWLNEYSRDFTEPPDFPCLKKLVAYLKFNMPGSEEERHAKLLLVHLEHLVSSEEKSEEWVPARTQSLELEPAPAAFLPRGASWESLESVDSQASEKKPSFMVFPPQLVAQQFTPIDAELFKKVVPYQCLEYIWFQGDKSAKGHVAPTVRAVVTHFNYVVNCVIQTCVGDENLDASDRAMVVENWIEVAWECQVLKNFSSFCAILTTLQSKAIHRLQRTWKEVASQIPVTFHVGSTARKVACLRMWYHSWLPVDQGVISGAIPFLGTFLNIMARVESSMEEYIHVSDHGFGELGLGGDGPSVTAELSQLTRHKGLTAAQFIPTAPMVPVDSLELLDLTIEFKVITNITMLQSACENYSFRPHEYFLEWFRDTEVLTMDESHQASNTTVNRSSSFQGEPWNEVRCSPDLSTEDTGDPCSLYLAGSSSVDMKDIHKTVTLEASADLEDKVTT